MNKIKLAIIGAGVRGRYTYGEFIKNNNDICEVVQVVETKIGRRKKFKEIFNLSPSVLKIVPIKRDAKRPRAI